jgi:HD-like signal output (HDOD) protein
MSIETVDKKNAIISETLASVGEITTLPEVTAKIMETVEDPNGTARDLNEVIKRDPALSAKVLKVINSAFYGLPGQIASVDRAIVLLGMSAVRNLAIAASVAKMFSSPQQAQLFDAKALWRHCVAVGVASKKIATAAGNVVGTDEMFLAGLIHDLGLLIERQVHIRELAEVVRRFNAGEGEFLELEIKIIGATHQEFGDALAERWKFPRHLRACVGFHHNPESLSEELRCVGSILKCADVFCCGERIGFSLTESNGTLAPELLDEAGVTLRQLEKMGEQLGREVTEAETVLGATS